MCVFINHLLSRVKNMDVYKQEIFNPSATGG